MIHVDHVDYHNTDHARYYWDLSYGVVVDVYDNLSRCTCCFCVGPCGVSCGVVDVMESCAAHELYIVDDNDDDAALAQNIAAKGPLNHHHARGYSRPLCCSHRVKRCHLLRSSGRDYVLRHRHFDLPFLHFRDRLGPRRQNRDLSPSRLLDYIY